uniref:Uncharacterized protein n=1 Tax=Panagrolaimus davidi TaxID=227884 RepID=A0A914QWD7_9BILA
MVAAVVADLTQAKKQCFSLPKPLINYSFDNSQLELSQNLIKCCKLFKFLHLKKNEARIIKMDISISSLQFYDHPSTPILTRNILKEIVKTEVENKIKTFYILPVSEVDLDDFLKLIDNYLAADCLIYFTSKKLEIFASYEQMFEKIVKIRKNASKKIQVKFRCERASYENIL